MERKNIRYRLFMELLSDTNFFLFTTELSPNELSIKKALALLQSMESMLEQDAKEGEQALKNSDNKSLYL